MNRDEFAASIDHTVLGPETTWSDVRTVLTEATEHGDRKSTRLNSSHSGESRMPSSA